MLTFCIEPLGTELALLVLFCAGFVLFRISAVQSFLFGSMAQKRLGAQGRKIQTKHVQVYAKSPVPNQQLHHLSGVEHTHMVRIISAVDAQRLPEAKQEMLAMHGAGYKVPASCIVAFGRSASESNFAEIPTEVLTVDAIIALLEHATKVGDSQLLRDVHQRGDELALLQAPAACEALVRSYAALGDSRAVEVFDGLVVKGWTPLEGVLTSVISLCAECRHVQMAECVFTHARHAKANLTLSLYAAMVKVYVHARLFNKACDVYDMMRETGVQPDTVVYGSLMKAAVESGRLELARQLFRESGNPDLLNYMSLIRLAGREKDLPKAFQLLEELEKAPLVIDATAYNCVLEVCVATGSRHAAATLLQRMEAKGHVDVVSYNTYMKLLFADAAHAEVDKVLKDMKLRGLRPSVVTYNSLIKDAVMHRDMQRAWALSKQMEEEGTSPDAFTCTILMKGAKHAPSSEGVDQIVDLIQRAKIVPDEVLVNCLLESCIRLRNIPRLVKILEEFKSTGVVPSLHACALLIKAYGHSRRLDCAWSVWHELTNERKVAPNEEVFGAMVDACLSAGDLQSAVSVFRETKHALCNFARGQAVFGAIVKACICNKQGPMAVHLYEEMRELSFTCNRITYNTIIDVLGRQGDMDKAAAVFQEMSLKAVSPDLISYTTLIKGHCAKGCLDQALQLLGLMQRQGISPDAIVFNSVLDGCAHKQMRVLTEQVLKDMEKAGIAPSNFTLSILVKLYGRCSDLDTAFHVVQTYPAKYNFKVNAQVYTCLMSACIAGGSLPRALNVYSDMIEAGCPTDAKMYQTLLKGCLRHGDLDAAARLVREALKQGLACLDAEIAEDTLFMMARRGRGADLGVPLLDLLDAANIRISSRVRSSVCKVDAPRQTTRR